LWLHLVAADMVGPKKKKNRPEDKMEGKNFGRGKWKKVDSEKDKAKRKEK
jgi:hypothetical protein